MVAHLTALTLRRLAPAEVGRLVTHVVGDKAFPPAVLQEVVRKTDGVPLFVEELTKTVLESGLLEEQEDRYALHGPLPPLAIPATLHDALLARLDRLAAAKVVAQLGATIGRTFAYDVVQAVAPLDAATLQGALAQLVEAEVVAQRGLPPQATYTFKHALIQDAAYESLLRSTRQQYHQRIAQVLAERFPETAETQPEVLAQHYTAAGLHAQALPYWQRAGQRALERSAYREAVGSFEQALSALPHLPEKRDTREQAIDLRLALRNALRPSGDLVERILALLREAEALAVALDDPRRLGQVSVILAQYFFSGARMTRPSPPASVPSHSPRPAGMSSCRRWRTNSSASPIMPRVTIVGQATASGRPWRPRMGHGATSSSVRSSCPPCSPVTFLAWCHAELGTFAEGRALGEEGLRIAEAVDHPYSLIVGLSRDRSAVSPPRRPVQGTPPARTGRGHLSRDADIPAYFPRMAAALGAAYTLGGRIADAVPLLTQALEQTTATGMAVIRRRSVVSPWGRHSCWLAVWRRRTPSLSGHWRLPVSTRNGGTRRMPCACSVTSPHGASLLRSSRPRPTISTPSPWPRNSACARCRRTVTTVSARCTARQAVLPWPAPRSPPPSSCTVPWT